MRRVILSTHHVSTNTSRRRRNPSPPRPPRRDAARALSRHARRAQRRAFAAPRRIRRIRGRDQALYAACRSMPRSNRSCAFRRRPSLPAPADVFDPTGVTFAATRRKFSRRSTSRRSAAIEQSLREQTQASVLSMQVWWLNRMLTTPAPLQEKMTFFFHGHFTSAAVQKGVRPTADLSAESTLSRVRARQFARTHARGFARSGDAALSR